MNGVSRSSLRAFVIREQGVVAIFHHGPNVHRDGIHALCPFCPRCKSFCSPQTMRKPDIWVPDGAKR